MKVVHPATTVHVESATSIAKDVIEYRGTEVPVRAIQIGNKRLVVHGRHLAVARLKDEWYEDVDQPELIVKSLKECRPIPDVFTFWQRLPDTVPLYSYYHEDEALSAIPLRDFQYWWEKQIKSDTRKKAKRATNRGIQIRVVQLDDVFVRGVMGIFNETPVRRGKPFWHYGKGFEAVKEQLSRDLDNSKFIGAYDDGTLIGFVKLVRAPGRFANPGLIVSKLEARKKYVNNALIAKSVELCCEDHIPYLTYTKWRRGTQAEFLIRHGFERTSVPRYWIPLTAKGKIALKLGFHRDIRSRIPEKLMGAILHLRSTFYNRVYGDNRSDDREAFGSKAEV